MEGIRWLKFTESIYFFSNNFKKTYILIPPPSKYWKKIIIGTTTNFSPQKDLITFVKVAYEIKKINKNVEFCIGGAIRNSQNNYTQQVMKEIKKLDLKNNIKLLDFVSDVPLYLSKLDIFINTSAWEGSPTAVWEALAHGLPVVTTDVGSIDYYVGKLKAGLVSRVGDHKGLSQNIIKFINSYELRKELENLKYEKKINKIFSL